MCGRRAPGATEGTRSRSAPWAERGRQPQVCEEPAALGGPFLRTPRSPRYLTNTARLGKLCCCVIVTHPADADALRAASGSRSREAQGQGARGGPHHAPLRKLSQVTESRNDSSTSFEAKSLRFPRISCGLPPRSLSCPFPAFAPHPLCKTPSPQFPLAKGHEGTQDGGVADEHRLTDGMSSRWQARWPWLHYSGDAVD